MGLLDAVGGLSFQGIMVIIGLVVTVSVFLLRNIVKKYMSGVIEDYVWDCGLSFLDELFGGAAALDWGDLIAAVKIAWTENKVVGFIPAAIVGLEAFNFFFMLGLG